MRIIKEFRDKYYFLSNFYNSKVTYCGVTFLNNEAAISGYERYFTNEGIRKS